MTIDEGLSRMFIFSFLSMLCSLKKTYTYITVVTRVQPIRVIPKRFDELYAMRGRLSALSLGENSAKIYIKQLTLN